MIVVDEEIYRRLPSLLITTVDKFAQMPWNGSVQVLFGQVDGYCERHGFRSPHLAVASEELEINGVHRAKGNAPSAKVLPHNPLRPPDLIIQDELHLISGPLGTLVGYFNSLRELGGMKRLVDDDVRTRLRKMADRGLANRTLYTPDTVKELTSRLGSAAIPETLDLLESRFDPEILEEIKNRKAGGEFIPRPLDVLLATNMISVGVECHDWA